MIKFKFTQTDRKLFILLGIFSVVCFRILQNYWGFGQAMFGATAITLVFSFLLRRYFTAVVEFRDSCFLLKKGLISKEVAINYSDLNKITYSYNRFIELNAYTATNKYKLPPPARLNDAKDLFAWLGTTYPTLKLEITN